MYKSARLGQFILTASTKSLNSYRLDVLVLLRSPEFPPVRPTIDLVPTLPLISSNISSSSLELLTRRDTTTGLTIAVDVE
jgi:hypothetical protein